MKIAVVVFSGSNCDIVSTEALHTVLDADVSMFRINVRI